MRQSNNPKSTCRNVTFTCFACVSSLRCFLIHTSLDPTSVALTEMMLSGKDNLRGQTSGFFENIKFGACKMYKYTEHLLSYIRDKCVRGSFKVLRGVLSMISLVFFICCYPCCSCYSYCSWVFHSVVKNFIKAETYSYNEDDEDKPSAIDAINNFLDTEKNCSKYLHPTEMKCLGSRLHKHWFKAQRKEDGITDVVMTVALVSKNCRINLDTTTLKGINELLATVNPQPFLHRIFEVSYDRNFQHVIVVQEYMTKGSLKDMIYKKAADADWSEKYRQRSRGLPSKTAAHYGGQILQAMMFLYRLGFPYHQLGHVQTGNVFVGSDNSCRLGGYDNTLLGYKTRLFRLCRQHEDHIDVVMFGHLLFEMCCGYELTTCVPGKQEYKTVKDKRLRSTLQYIFEEGFPHSIEEISDMECFKDQQIHVSMNEPLSQPCQTLLDQIKTNSPRQQDAPTGKRREPLSIVEGVSQDD